MLCPHSLGTSRRWGQAGAIRGSIKPLQPPEVHVLFQALLLLFQGAQAAQLHPGEVLEGPKGKQHLPGARGEHRGGQGGHTWGLQSGISTRSRTLGCTQQRNI